MKQKSNFAFLLSYAIDVDRAELSKEDIESLISNIK